MNKKPSLTPCSLSCPLHLLPVGFWEWEEGPRLQVLSQRGRRSPSHTLGIPLTREAVCKDQICSETVHPSHGVAGYGPTRLWAWAVPGHPHPRPGECSDGLAVTSHFRPPEAWKLRFSPSWNVAPHGRWPGSLPRREGLHAEEGPGNGQRQPLTREQGYLASSGPCHLPGQALAHLAGESPAAPAQSVDPQDRKQIQCFLL